MALKDHRFLKSFRGQIAGQDLLQDEDQQIEVKTTYGFVSGIVKDVISNPYEYLNRNLEGTSHLLKDVLSGRVKPEISLNGAPPAPFDYSSDIENAELIDTMPMNSIFAYIVDNYNARDTGKYVICYPMFPPHMSLPLKPGEYVWILKETIGPLNYYYWFCRKVAPIQIDDINFTNLERIPAINDLIAAKTKDNQTSYLLNDAYSLDEITDRYDNKIKGTAEGGTNFPEPLSDLFKNSYAFTKEFTAEPTPRLAKGCGDLLLQGSNNAGLQITTEKFLPVNKALGPYTLGNSSKLNEKPDAAAIDLFVGRKKESRRNIAYSGRGAFLNDKREKTDKMNFAANNSEDSIFDYIENDKIADIRLNDPEVYNHELNDNALDAVDIAARLYLSHNSSPDIVFGSAFDVLSPHSGESIVTFANHNRMIGNIDARIVSVKGESFVDLDPFGNVVIKSSINGGQQFLSLSNQGVTRLQGRSKIEISQSGNGSDTPEIQIQGGNTTVTGGNIDLKGGDITSEGDLITLTGKDNITITAGTATTNPKFTTIFSTQEGGVQVVNPEGEEGEARGVLGLGPLVTLLRNAGAYGTAGFNVNVAGPGPQVGVFSIIKPILDAPNPQNPPQGAVPTSFEQTGLFFILSQMATKYFYAE